LVLPATYLDSNVISYLTARPSRDIVSLAHQELTHEWWNRQRHNFDLHISELVMFEIGRGDPIAAASRRMLVRDCQSFKSLPRRARLRIGSSERPPFRTRPLRMLCTLRWPRSTEWIFC
jgi:hypothetical protein